MLAENLTKYREAQNLSKTELAKRSGLTPRAIEFIEHKVRKNPKIETVQKLAKALGITVNDLIK